MAKLYTSGKDTSIKVPYQPVVSGARVLPKPRNTGASEFAEQRSFIRERPLTFRHLSER